MASVRRGAAPLAPGIHVGDLPTWDGRQWQPAQPAVPAAIPPGPGSVVNNTTVVYVDGAAVPASSLVPLTAGCLVRCEADFGVNVANGAPVPTWIPADRAGGFDMTDAGTVGGAPTFRRQDVQGAFGDNLPFIEFDGVANRLGTLDTFAYAGNDITIYMVARSYVGLGVANPRLLSVLRNATTPGLSAGTLSLRAQAALPNVELQASGAQCTDGTSQGGIGRFMGTWQPYCIRMANIGGQQVLNYWRGTASGWSLYFGPVGGGGFLGWDITRIGLCFNGDGAAFGNDFHRADVRHFSLYETAHRDDQVRYMGNYLTRHGCGAFA